MAICQAGMEALAPEPPSARLLPALLKLLGLAGSVVEGVVGSGDGFSSATDADLLPLGVAGVPLVLLFGRR
ncbi:hypothetical protein HYQ46_002938 [Verticillium longisporum]|nr:hypothetical protein HYQ46_002938 [Verticillium longisporum]